MDTINNELRALGYIIKNSEITSPQAFVTAADLCAKIDKLAIVSTVIGEDIRERIGIDSVPTCLVFERDNYLYIPLSLSADKIKAMIADVVSNPIDRGSPCVVCKSEGTSNFCTNCTCAICNTCTTALQIPVLREKGSFFYSCPSCGQILAGTNQAQKEEEKKKKKKKKKKNASLASPGC